MRDFEYKWTRGYKIGTPPPPSGLSRSTLQTPEAEPATARVACWATADDKRAANSAPFRGSDGSSPGRRAVAEDADPASHHARPPSDRRLATLLLPDPERRVRRFLFLYANDFRAMAWMQIGADGSLYLNPRRKASGPAYHAKGVADGKCAWLTCCGSRSKRRMSRTPRSRTTRQDW